MVRKSTFWYDSMQGRTKNIPKVEIEVLDEYNIMYADNPDNNQ